MYLESEYVTRIIDLALDEDGSFGDSTSDRLIDPSLTGTGTLHVKEAAVLCGLPLLQHINLQFSKRRPDTALVAKALVPERETKVQPGTDVAVIEGPVQALLTLERVYLNFLQRLSGIATLTESFVSVAGKNKILDTRETIPGHRLLEKYAVACGGGKNHRINLSELILIKNNHIDAVQGDFAALKKKLDQAAAPFVPVEVEVRDQTELEETLTHIKPFAVMLDNYSDKDILDAVDYIKAHAPQVQIEVSGGLTKERIASLSKILEGVYFSVGALTTRAPNIDISMKIG